MRKYALTKAGQGDYLAPANDGLGLWRIRSYSDGSAHGADLPFRDRIFWEASYAAMPESGYVDLECLDDLHWTYHYTHLPTRKAALESVFGADS